jgi:hypothetical protein
MRNATRALTTLLGITSAFLLFLPGCGQSGAHVPSEKDARQALEASLTAWREGRPSTSLAASTPAVHPADYRWQAGEALEGFEILKEEPGETEKRFLVKVKMKKASSAKESRYMVLGSGPFWVYHEDDYTRLLSMDNNPQARSQRVQSFRPR